MTKYWIDPPSGWKYGFPKIIEYTEDLNVIKWLTENGYPQTEIDKFPDYFPARWWPVQEGVDVYDSSSYDEIQSIPQSMFKMEE